MPVLSKHIKAGEKQEANTQLNRGLEISIAMSLASMIGLVLLAHPIIAVLFERGAFTMTDTEQTSKALIVFAFGLPAYMMTKALSPFFYARSDTTTPVKIAVVGVILNAVLALSLMGPLGFIGIALATSITVWVNAFQYMWRLKKQGEFSLDKLFMYRIKRIVLAGCMMTVALYSCFAGLSTYTPAWQHEHGLLSVLYLGGLIGIGVVSFAGILIGSGGITVKDIKSFLRRG